MGVTLDQLILWRDALLEARYQGVRRVRDSSGDEIEYRSDAEMAKAIAAASAQIEQFGRGYPRTIYLRTSKGL